MLKILQARLQQYVNRELPDVQAGFRKGLNFPSLPFSSLGKPLQNWQEHERECGGVHILTQFRKSQKAQHQGWPGNAKLSPIWGSIWNSRECTMELQLNLIRSGGLHHVRLLILYNSPVRLLLFWSHCTSSECGSIRRSHVLNETVSKDNQRTSSTLSWDEVK